jgi:hypothetical protein
MSTKTRSHHHSDHAEMREKPTAPAWQEAGAEERFRLIQARAYGLWEQAGKPNGNAARERFWCEAERRKAGADPTDGILGNGMLPPRGRAINDRTQPARPTLLRKPDCLRPLGDPSDVH